MDWKTKTIKAYNDSARAWARYFAGIGPRIKDIELALQLCGSQENISVVEIGCGDGRDALEIIPRVTSYKGVDPSEGLLAIARERLPQANFIQADALSYEYPTDVDVVYAFASLLHINKQDMRTALEKAGKALRAGGIYYISLKEREKYAEEAKPDRHGERMFYYYNPSLITVLASPWFETVHEDHQIIGRTAWFTIALKRR